MNLLKQPKKAPEYREVYDQDDQEGVQRRLKGSETSDMRVNKLEL
jgi:hypothetical protein